MKSILDDPKMDSRDLNPYIYPPLTELKKLNYRSICLGSYIPWDVKNNTQLIKEKLDWEEDLNAGIPPEYAYEKVECEMQGIRDYIKFIKRGYGRTAHLTAIDIRNGRIGENKAKSLIKEYDGKRPASLDYFLSTLSITESEFNEVAKSHRVYPSDVDPETLEKGKKLADQDLWDKSSNLDRSYAKKKLEDHGF